MSDGRKRGADGTLQRRIVVALTNASMSPHMLVEIVGGRYDSCRKACGYLVKRGCITKHRLSRRLVIYARVPGRHPPKDLRGLQPECRNNRGAIAWAGWLRMMRAKHGPGWAYKPRAHPLDAWGTP